MKHLSVVILCVWLSVAPGCRPRERSKADTGLAVDTVMAWNLKREPSELSSVELFPVPGHPELAGAICDYENDWWGFMTVYGIEDGRILWQAACTQPPGEQSVYRMRPLNLKGFRNPVFEVVGQTHMGNGSLYLYELRERTLVLLLETRVIANLGNWRTLEQCLVTEYRDVNLDGREDIELSGSVIDEGDFIGGEGDEGIVGQQPATTYWCRKMFLWDADAGRYVENFAYREGPDWMHDRRPDPAPVAETAADVSSPPRDTAPVDPPR